MKKEEVLWDYAQLFELLELELYPWEIDEDGESKYDEVTLHDYREIAVKEYYEYLASFWYQFEEQPEFVTGMKILRKLLSDLGESNSYISGVWNTMSEVESDESLLRIALPLIFYMWD